MYNCAIRATLGEAKAAAAALEHTLTSSHFIVGTDEPGYAEFMIALDVLQTCLRDHADYTSDQQMTNVYALMRQIYRLTGKMEDAQEMHRLCIEHSGDVQYDIVGHALLRAQQNPDGERFSFPALLQ